MRFIHAIEIKKRGGELEPGQLAEAVDGYVRGDVPDYQMAALLMAMRCRGLTDAETAALTEAMVGSGERWDWSDLDDVAVDKHSTGGVGDKVSLPLAPLAAAGGCLVPMVSGRGLGHTGGTLDKLESIPGFRVGIDRSAFRDQLGRIGVAMGAATERLAPADRLLYSLRDVTATVDDPGLITASILSKKIAEGARGLVLDVKVGSGTFCTDLDAARELARRLLEVAKREGLRCRALLTAMDRPLGRAVGNAPEVREAIACLRGEGPEDLRQLVLELAARMFRLADLVDSDAAGRVRAEELLDSGAALERFAALVEAQGGDPSITDRPDDVLPTAAHRRDLRAPDDGFVREIDARAVGEAMIELGAGRRVKEDDVDPAAGAVLRVRPGDPVEAGSPWITLHHSDRAAVEDAERHLAEALVIGEDEPTQTPLILEEIE